MVNAVVEESNVEADTGTTAFGYKGDVGTSSRIIPNEYGACTVGVIVQSNFGGNLTIAGTLLG